MMHGKTADLSGWLRSKHHGTTFHIPVERFIYGTVASLSDVRGEKQTF